MHWKERWPPSLTSASSCQSASALPTACQTRDSCSSPKHKSQFSNLKNFQQEGFNNNPCGPDPPAAQAQVQVLATSCPGQVLVQIPVEVTLGAVSSILWTRSCTSTSYQLPRTSTLQIPVEVRLGAVSSILWTRSSSWPGSVSCPGQVLVQLPVEVRLGAVSSILWTRSSSCPGSSTSTAALSTVASSVWRNLFFIL